MTFNPYIISLILLFIVAFAAGPVFAQDIPSSPYDFTVKSIDGVDLPLQQFRGKVVLIVNVASLCGLTPQYKELQTLYEKYRDKGFTILAFPANNFRDQEPGSNESIKQFCTNQFSVTFPLFAKISVGGDDIHPLYRLLTNPKKYPESGGPIRWNFDKFLISADGQTIKRFAPKTTPLSEELTQALEALLK